MGLRTIVLKLHKPSRIKCEIIDSAILNYNNAFRYLLKRAYMDLKEIRKKYEGKKGCSCLTLSKWIDNEIGKDLNRFDVQPFKDSIKLDFGMTLASYLSIGASNPKASFPKFKELENTRDNGLLSRSDIKEAGLSGVHLRPIYFCRYDTKRSYCILYDRKRDRYFAKLYLMNNKNAKRVSTDKQRRGELFYISKNSSAVGRGKRKESFIIMPLSFGKYQEEFLKQALDKPEILRTAKLSKRGNEYYLAVSIETGQNESIECNTFMGVSRGLKSKLNYTIVDTEGNILDSGPLIRPKNGVNKHPVALDELHKTANIITGIALKNKSRVILQNLIEKSDKLDWIQSKENIRSEYSYSTYIQLTKLLEYKLRDKGLPSPMKVSSVNIFYSCYECGHYSRQNRLNSSIFICTQCGATMDIDSLGGLNLARKLINYDNSRIKIKVTKSTEGMWLSNKLIDLNCYITYEDNPLEKLKDEIRMITQNIKEAAIQSERKEFQKRMSIIKKLQSSEDFINLIEFV